MYLGLALGFSIGAIFFNGRMMDKWETQTHSLSFRHSHRSQLTLTCDV